MNFIVKTLTISFLCLFSSMIGIELKLINIGVDFLYFNSIVFLVLLVLDTTLVYYNYEFKNKLNS